jgi:hypothetical protein
MWSTLNIVRVALMQVGAVIASILVGGVYHKFSSTSEPLGNMPPYQSWWYHYGGFGFCLPIVWVAISLYVYSHDDISEHTKFFVFWSGVLAFVALAVMVVISLVSLFMPNIRM